MFAVGAAVGAWLVGRSPLQALLAGGAVLLVQLIAGLMNDVSDAPLDRAAGRLRKPIALGQVPPGNATFVATALFLVAVPMSLQNGVTAGLILLGTLVVALIHNRRLHRTPFSFLGWMVTLPMIAAFVSYADSDVAGDPATAGSAPTSAMLLVMAAVGLVLHLATSLRDLPLDHKAGIRPLPLVLALRTGAPRLMWITIVLAVVTGVALVLVALGPGLHR